MSGSKECDTETNFPQIWTSSIQRTRRNRVLSRLSVLGLVGLTWLLIHKSCIGPSHSADESLAYIEEDWKSLPVGTVKWWPCEGPDALEGSECGYIMYVLVFFKSV